MAEPQAAYDVLVLIAYLVFIGAALSLLYGLSEWLSRDRVLKILEDKDVLVVLGSEAYYGKLHVPPRSGGGFEIFFPSNRVENPKSLLTYLKENYKRTGDKKFLERAERLLKEFKKSGLVDENLTLDSLDVNPWSPPSLVSRKVYPDELKNLFAIMRFKDFMSEEELRKLREEFAKVYNPPFHWRLKRKVWNVLSYVRDRVSSSLSALGALPQALPVAKVAPAAISAQVQKDVTEIEKKLKEMQAQAIATMAEYDALLENSLGHLLTVKVVDIEGEEKTYQGVLREYSKNYVLLYGVNYRIQMRTRFKGQKECEGYPRPVIKLYGMLWEDEKHLAIASIEKTDAGSRVALRNVSSSPLRVEKVKVKVPKEGGVEEKEIGLMKVIFPGEEVSIEVPGPPESLELEIEYEVTKEVDIAWPRSKVRIVGLGDYPTTLLDKILSASHVFKRRAIKAR